MTDVNTLRTTYLNRYLERTEGDLVPWSDADCNQLLADALGDLWPDLASRASGTVATDGETQVYTIPASLQRVSRIDVETTDGLVVDQVTNWRYRVDADPPTEIVIAPRLASGYVLRVTGWKPYASNASDLLARLENTVCYLAASLAYGLLAASLANSQRQQGLDSGRVVDYQTAVGLAAYWQRRYADAVRGDPNNPAGALRRARR